jgi:putative hemolysin
MISVTGEEGKGVLIATVIASMIIIITEVAAKTYAAVNSEKVSLTLARHVARAMSLFSPVVRVVVYIANGIVKALGGSLTVRPSLMVEEEVKAMIKTIEEEPGAHREKYRMISKIFDFSDAVVGSVMTPRKDIVSVDVASSLDDILEKALECGYSRIPVYKDNPDNIIGVMNMKDLLNLSCNRDLIVLQDIIYPATFVSSATKVTELLRDFQKGHTHLAAVRDEGGRIDGVITLEDLLEEIVGEIEDEYDVRYSKMKRKN